MKNVNIFLFAAALTLAACESAPKSDEAKTGEAQKVDTSKTSQAQSLQLDLTNSFITWVGTKPTGKHNGTFNLSEGFIAVKENQVVGGKFTIDINSLKVLDIPAEDPKNTKLTNHLKSPDFFDAEKYPTAMFEVVSVETFKPDTTQKSQEKEKEYILENPTHTITGNLTLKGVSKSISFPAIIKMENGKVLAEAKFNINRKDWGMEYGTDEAKLKDKFISPIVHIGFKISSAVQQ